MWTRAKTMRKLIKLLLFILVGFVAVITIFLLYATIGNEVETSRVEAAIQRDCSVKVEINADEIAEPGIVSKSLEVNGTPIALVCYGATNWSCECMENQQATPTAISTDVPTS
jgi:hypothetical protein